MKVSEIMAQYEPFALNKPTYGCLAEGSLAWLEKYLHKYGEEIDDPMGAVVSVAVKLAVRITQVQAYALIDCLYTCDELVHNPTASAAIFDGPFWFRNLISGYPGCYVWTMAEVYYLREGGQGAFSERFGAHRSWEEIRKRNPDTPPLWFPYRTGSTYSRSVYPTENMRLENDLNPVGFYSAHKESKNNKALADLHRASSRVPPIST